MAGLAAWLETTGLATWTRESPSLWAYPTVLTLHTVGLGIVVGANAVIDLRLLGFAPRVPAPTLAPLFRLIWWAFALNAATGVLLFMADAVIKSKQPVFYAKLTLIALALWNTALIKPIVKGDRPRPDAHDTPDAPDTNIATGRAKRLAVVSLLLWTGAITAGRLMAYL